MYTIRCDYCDKSFRKNKLLEFHLNSVHKCRFCLFESGNPDELKSHVKTHTSIIREPQRGGKRKRKSFHPFHEIKAFNGFLKSYRHRIKKKISSVQDYFISYKSTIFEILEQSLNNINSIKFQISLHCEFIKENNVLTEIQNEICHHYVNSDLRVALNKYYIPKIYKEIISQLDHSVEIFEKNGSGWQLNRVIGCDIRIAEFEILKAGQDVLVPKPFRKKRAIVNPLNSKNQCFLYSFLIQMHYNDVPKYRRGSCVQYDKFKYLYNWSSVTFPTSIRQVSKFEKDNEDKNFAINIWGVDNKNVLNIKYQSKFCRDKTRQFVNLLYVQDSGEENGHFMTITQITRLLGQSSRHLRSPCYNCFSTFAPEQLKIHEELCFQFKHQRTIMPREEEAVCYFKDVQKRLKTRFVIFADFESLCKPSKENTSTKYNVINEHEPSGYCIAISDSYSKKKDPVKFSLYRGPNAMNFFLEELNLVSENLLKLNENKLSMQKLTKKEEERFLKSKKCHICEYEFKTSSDKVKDHCPVTGQFRNPAHHSCNAKYAQPDKIPVVMHSFKTFDLQLLLSNITKFPDKEVTVIPNNSEKFVSIITSKFFFVDSLMHLNASLSNLVDNLNPLKSNRKQFKNNFLPLIKIFGYKKARELCRKGVYPYEHMTSFQRFREETFPLKKFFNKFFSR